MKTAAVHPALLPFLCGSLVDARPQAAAGLFEQLTAKEGDPPTFILRPAHIYPVYPPTFILCTCKGGRVALPPLATYQQRCFFKGCSVKTADALREADEKRGSGTT